MTGLTKAEANKLDPAALFGLLPSELGKKILNPKETGIKVAQNTISNESLNNSVKEILKIKNPNIKIDSEKGRLEGNKIYSNIIKNIKFYLPKGRDWRKGKLSEKLEKELNTPEQAKIVLQAIEAQKRIAKVDNEIKNSKLRVNEKTKKDIIERIGDDGYYIFPQSKSGEIIYTFRLQDSSKGHITFSKFFAKTGRRPNRDKLLKMSFKEFIIKEKQGFIKKIIDL